MKKQLYISSAIVLLLVVNFFVVQMVHSDQEENLLEIRLQLLKIKNYNNEENEILLLASTSKIIMYDEVVKKHKKIEEICIVLGQQIHSIEEASAYDGLMRDLLAEVKAKNNLIQQFKSRNSVLLNSMNSLNLLKNNPADVSKEAKNIRKLKEDVLFYKAFGGEQMLQIVRTDLNTYSQTALNSDNELKMLVIHASNVLSAEKSSSDILQEIIKSPIVAKANNIRNQIAALSTQYLNIVKNSLITFVAINVLLFILLGLLAIKLNAQSESLIQLNQTLEETVEKRTRRLARRNDDLQQFGYIATHDLKVPVDNIKGYMQILTEYIDKDSQEAGEIVAWIDKCLKQSDNILQDLVKVAKSGINVEENKPIELQSIYDSVLETQSFTVQELDATITSDFSQTTSVILSELHLRSIFENLISNALKYSCPDRPVQIIVTSKTVGEMIRVDFKDNGLGIDLGIQYDKLFGLFKRIYITEKGSGLGLYLIKQIIDDAEGKIEVDSTVGVGSTFSVYLKS